ncbi:hypothetical protein ACLOJK_013689 [Asimina triloba]
MAPSVWDFAKSAEAMFSGWAIKRVCKYFLKKKLGEFLLGDLDLDQLDVQLGKGTIQLTDVALNVDYINRKCSFTMECVVESSSFKDLLAVALLHLHSLDITRSSVIVGNLMDNSVHQHITIIISVFYWFRVSCPPYLNYPALLGFDVTGWGKCPSSVLSLNPCYADLMKRGTLEHHGNEGVTESALLKFSLAS